MADLIIPVVVSLGAVYLSLILYNRSRPLSIPRIGPKPGFLGNTSQGYFQSHSVELVEDGYAKHKDGLYSLWTTDMDRVIVSPKFMKDFMSLPRSTVRLTASIRHAGPYTGMDIAEDGDLQFVVCAGQLTQNIGRLAQPVFDEISFALQQKLASVLDVNGSFALPIFPLMIQLVTSATARVFVGSELCRNPEWLSTATGYTMDVAKVTTDLNQHYRFLHPIIAPLLASSKQIKGRFALARKLLLPLIEARRGSSGKDHPDMMQWMIDSAKGDDGSTDKLVRRMLFLNMAAIHTTAEATTLALMELCAQPATVRMLREEMQEALKDDDEISLATLNKLKKTDSFIKESHRLNGLGLMTFNRHLVKPVHLSNGVTLPSGTYISMSHYPIHRDPEFYPDPLKFDPLRYYNLRQKEGAADRYQFSSISSTEPAWGVGKFACPGRFWASAQIKLILMVLLTKFNIGFPDGQTEKPARKPAGEKLQTDFSQKMVLTKTWN
ncbi:cytochrome P450 [Lophiotrema nucula]|uniref:Cytochrome P450 n=1 Tax=Lophiotrema nucula TaxID=690887 RepID=A0A6A5ZSQ2_9PLEO|nr:cytochrome P450 [Lophiotrema nucula]